jgi:hypothetical protein
LGFRQQDAVGHQFDQGIGIALILEPYLIADQRTQRRRQLFSNPARDAAGGDSTRLGVADQAMLTATDFQADFRQLGGFTRTGFAGNDQHLMLEQRLLDFVALGGDRQAVVVTNHRQAGTPRQYLITGRLHTRHPLGQLGLVGLLAQLKQLPPQPVAVGKHGVIEVFQQFVDGRRFVSHQVRNKSSSGAGGGLSQILRPLRGRIASRLAPTRALRRPQNRRHRVQKWERACSRFSCAADAENYSLSRPLRRYGNTSIILPPRIASCRLFQ